MAVSGSNASGAPSTLARWRRDTSLVEAVRRGNPRAFDAIYRRHHPALLSYCRHLLGCQHEAEDAVQQTFLNAYAAIARDERELRLRPWLYRIAHNHCISVLRRRRERANGPIEISTAGLSSQVERREEVRAMLRDIAELPETQREALILSELDTLSHAEIAEVIDCPEKRVKALVFQARTALAKCREAREVSCDEIQQQLSVLRGGSLRRTVIRRHLLECENCRAFRVEVRRQRAAAAILLPAGALPGLGSLLPAAAASLGGGGAGAGAVAGGGAAGGASGASGAGFAGAGLGAAVATAGANALPFEAAARRIAAAGVLALIAAAGIGANQHGRVLPQAGQLVPGQSSAAAPSDARDAFSDGSDYGSAWSGRNPIGIRSQGSGGDTTQTAEGDRKRAARRVAASTNEDSGPAPAVQVSTSPPDPQYTVLARQSQTTDTDDEDDSHGHGKGHANGHAKHSTGAGDVSASAAASGGHTKHKSGGHKQKKQKKHR